MLMGRLSVVKKTIPFDEFYKSTPPLATDINKAPRDPREAVPLALEASFEDFAESLQLFFMERDSAAHFCVVRVPRPDFKARFTVIPTHQIQLSSPAAATQ